MQTLAVTVYTWVDGLSYRESD